MSKNAGMLAQVALIFEKRTRKRGEKKKEERLVIERGKEIMRRKKTDKEK